MNGPKTWTWLTEIWPSPAVLEKSNTSLKTWSCPFPCKGRINNLLSLSCNWRHYWDVRSVCLYTSFGTTDWMAFCINFGLFCSFYCLKFCLKCLQPSDTELNLQHAFVYFGKLLGHIKLGQFFNESDCCWSMIFWLAVFLQVMINRVMILSRQW